MLGPAGQAAWTLQCSCCRISRGRTVCRRTWLKASVDFLLPAAWRFATVCIWQTLWWWCAMIRSEAGPVVCSPIPQGYSFFGVEFSNVFNSLFFSCNYVFSSNKSFKTRVSSAFSADNKEKLYSAVFMSTFSWPYSLPRRLILISGIQKLLQLIFICNCLMLFLPVNITSAICCNYSCLFICVKKTVTPQNPNKNNLPSGLQSLDEINKVNTLHGLLK